MGCLRSPQRWHPDLQHRALSPTIDAPPAGTDATLHGNCRDLTERDDDARSVTLATTRLRARPGPTAQRTSHHHANAVRSQKATQSVQANCTNRNTSTSKLVVTTVKNIYMSPSTQHSLLTLVPEISNTFKQVSCTAAHSRDTFVKLRHFDKFSTCPAIIKKA